MYGWSEIAYANESERLRKIDVAAAFHGFIHIDRTLHADLTRGHIDIFVRVSVAEDDAAQKLRLVYQNISLRQSI